MLPELFLKRMQTQLGAEYEDYLQSLERPRAVALRFNPLKGDAPSLPFVINIRNLSTTNKHSNL